MDKREACHMLAEINEQIYDAQIALEKIESKLRLNDENREWYEEKRAEKLEDLERYQQEHDDFISEYGDIIYS